MALNDRHAEADGCAGVRRRAVRGAAGDRSGANGWSSCRRRMLPCASGQLVGEGRADDRGDGGAQSATRRSNSSSCRDGLVPLKDACIRLGPKAKTRRRERSGNIDSVSCGCGTKPTGWSAASSASRPRSAARSRPSSRRTCRRSFRERRASQDREPHEAYAADVLANAFLGAGLQSARTTTVHIS